MTPEEEDKIVAELKDVLLPEMTRVQLITSDRLEQMYTVGGIVENELDKRGLPRDFLLKYLIRKEAEAAERQRQHNVQVAEAAAAAAARQNPYKCPSCAERFSTTDKRRDHVQLRHKGA